MSRTLLDPSLGSEVPGTHHYLSPSGTPPSPCPLQRQPQPSCQGDIQCSTPKVLPSRLAQTSFSAPPRWPQAQHYPETTLGLDCSHSSQPAKATRHKQSTQEIQPHRQLHQDCRELAVLPNS